VGGHAGDGDVLADVEGLPRSDDNERRMIKGGGDPANVRPTTSQMPNVPWRRARPAIDTAATSRAWARSEVDKRPTNLAVTFAIQHDSPARLGCSVSSD
jgi:hypothetical protein